jgi:ABC-type microcin C transport system permease subunit YejE
LLFALAVIALKTVPSNSLVLGPLFAIAVTFVLHRHDHARARLPTLISLMPWLVMWSVCAHTAIDSLGLGVQPPAPSWGTLLWVKSGSSLPNLVVGLSLLVLGIIALVLSEDETTLI